ncbi:MAG: ABC transporter substrate-binding protein [Candidatus Rokuibacteriota bacterium]
MTTPRASRRRFLKTAAASALVAGVPLPLRAQGRTIKIGAVHPVTGPLAEVGQLCRLGGQIAVDAINAAGGIKSMGGARLELLTGDSESKPEVARTVAERLINDGATMLTGAFHSGHIMAMVPVAQQRQVPFIVDIGAADVITANVARSVKEGKQKTQYVYRVFPTTATFGAKAVQYMTEIFKETKTAPKRVVVMFTNDAFGKPQSESFVNAVKAASPGFEIVEVIPFPEDAKDLSTEVSRAKSLKPDVLAPITRPTTAILLLQELTRQRMDLLGVISPGAPGLYEPRQLEILKEHIEYVMSSTVWPNLKAPATQKLSDEHVKRAGGKYLDANAAYTYDAVSVMADVLERAKATGADALVEAIKKTNLGGQVAVAAGPIRFNDNGDNANASTAMIQILKNKPLVVWPKEAAQASVVFPRPKM